MTKDKPTRLRRGVTLEHVYTPYESMHIGHIDSAFQSQEYIAQLILQDPHDVQRIVSMPKVSPEDEKGSIDEGCWLFEQLRRLAQDLTYPLITNLQVECTRETCPEMKAGEWLYLCVAHGNNVGGHVQCCAIDYIVHTLDSATALLNSSRVFPSRLSVPQSSYRHFSSLARRLSRIFAHAFYHHRELFSQAEAESSLYGRFLALSQQHSLVPAELLVIPLEGLESSGRTGSSDEYEHEHEREREGDSAQGAEPEEEREGEGTFMPGDPRGVQARQLFDDGWTGEGQGTNEDDQEEEGEEDESSEEEEEEGAASHEEANRSAEPEDGPGEGEAASESAPVEHEQAKEEEHPKAENGEANGGEKHVEEAITVDDKPAEPPAPETIPEPEAAPEAKVGDAEKEPAPDAPEQPHGSSERPPSPAKDETAPQEGEHKEKDHDEHKSAD